MGTPQDTPRPSPGPLDLVDEGTLLVRISEEDFVRLLSEPLRDFVAQTVLLAPREPGRWSKKFCFHLREKAHELETFLDDYDARNNRRFAYFAELVASTRGFSAIAHTLHHVRVRLPKYQVQVTVEEVEEFQRALAQTSEFVMTSLSRLLQAVWEEARQIGVELPRLEGDSSLKPETAVRQQLPHDLDVEERSSDAARVAVVLSHYLDVLATLRGARRLSPERTLEAMHRFVDKHYDETQARALESRVHNIQSAYDTHVKFTTIEQIHPNLRSFRGHISTVLHLFEVGTLLIHFFERHENLIHESPAKERIAQLVDKEDVLEHAIFFALFRGIEVLRKALPLVEELVPQFTQQATVELEIPGDGILHARPLSLIVKVVRQHRTPVDMVIGEQACSANSIMSLILFVGQNPGMRTVAFHGDRGPLEDLRLLFEHGLGETGIDHFPEQLAYLRE